MYLQVLVGTCFVFAVASEVVTQHNITCEPHVVQFNDDGEPTRLRVDLKLVNIPTRGLDTLDYTVIACSVEDGQYIHKFTLKAGANLKTNQTFILEHNFNRYWNNLHIAVCLHKDTALRCDFYKDKFYDMITLKYTEEETYDGCTASGGRCELTLDVGNYCKNLNTSGSPDHGEPKLHFSYIATGHYGCWVYISCSVVGQKFDLLSLYQNRTKGNKHVLLKMVQYLKDEEGNITLTLNKTLSVSDTESKIYCDKQKPDHPSYKRTSKVDIFRHRDFDYLKYRPLVTNITVEPDTETAEFGRDKPLSLVCKGTALLHDQNLTWYIRDQNTSELEVPDASSQQYNQATNESRLTLWLNGSYDSKTLFCAQDGHLVVEHASGRRSVVRYGEAATSQYITLKFREKTDDVQTGGCCVTCSKTSTGIHPHNDTSWWVLGAVVGVASLWIILLIVAALRLRRKVHELESKIQADEAIRARAPCPLPENPTYEQVYAHGAGLMRPRCK